MKEAPPLTELPNLLIVDDRKENILAMEDLLSGLEAHLHTASSGLEALKKCSHTDFALVLLDVQMPGMDGFEVAETLRSIEKTRQMPIIFVTANEADNDRLIRGYESGGVDFLKKPIIPQILLSKVNIFLEIDNSKKRLIKLNKQMEEFVAIVSHDLRSPIAAIISATDPDFINQFETVEELAEVLQDLNNTGENCLNIVNDLLDLVALETGHIRISKVPFDLGACCRSLAGNLKGRAQSKGVELTTDIDDGVMVNADQARIVRVIDNLICNAIKFTSSGDTILIQIKAQPDGVLVKVKDSGVGIKVGNIGKLFSKHIVHSTKGTDGEMGTGFGLPLCQNIAQAHGTIIKVSSEPGVGSEFYFALEAFKGDSS